MNKIPAVFPEQSPNIPLTPRKYQKRTSKTEIQAVKRIREEQAQLTLF